VKITKVFLLLSSFFLIFQTLLRAESYCVHNNSLVHVCITNTNPSNGDIQTLGCLGLTQKLTLQASDFPVTVSPQNQNEPQWPTTISNPGHYAVTSNPGGTFGVGKFPCWLQKSKGS